MNALSDACPPMAEVQRRVHDAVGTEVLLTFVHTSFSKPRFLGCVRGHLKVPATSLYTVLMFCPTVFERVLLVDIFFRTPAGAPRRTRITSGDSPPNHTPAF